MSLGEGAPTVTVKADELTTDPTKLWERYKSQGRVNKKIPPLIDANSPKSAQCLRFVCISDTHNKLGEILPGIPDGDVLIHAGDFTCHGNRDEISRFNAELGQLLHRHKIIIAGNHELGFEDDEDCRKRAIYNLNHGTPRGYELLTNCTYLQDRSIEIDSIQIYGSAWHPLQGFSFARERGQELLEKWNLIPTSSDILITHTPPLGHGDLVPHWNERTGCAELLNTVEQRVRPAFHIFGHVHESYGLTTNGTTVFINASICDNLGRPVNSAILFDFPKRT